MFLTSLRESDKGKDGWSSLTLSNVLEENRCSVNIDSYRCYINNGGNNILN